MVSTTGDRSAYLGSSQGAPPPPPPGGYRGAQRVPPAPPSVDVAPVARPRPTIVSWIALGVASVFALVLLVMWAAGATEAIYGVVTLAFQLGIVIAVVAALIDRRGRLLGSIALTIVLLVNVGTMGAASAIGHHPGRDAIADPQADRWVAYPGIHGQTSEEILARPSLEDVERTADAVLAVVRSRLTREFGVEWVQGVAGGTRAERNGYGGESLLVQYGSGNWATLDPITGYDLKLEVMGTISDVIEDYGFWSAVPLNDPSSGFDPAYLERFYGSTDPHTQYLWEWYSDDYPGPIRFYATLADLTHDDDGTFRAVREGQVAGSDEPVEGLRIMVLAPEVLSEADVEEFLRRMEDYPGG